MNTHINQVKKRINQNRWIILAGVVIYAMLCTLITMVLQRFNLMWLALILLTGTSFVYLNNIHQITLQLNNDDAISIKDFFKAPKFDKRTFVAYLGYFIWAVGAFFTLRILSSFPQMGLFLIGIMLIILVLSNALSAVYLNSKTNESYFSSMKTVLSQRKLFGFSLMKSITVLIQGLIITVCVNVLVFGPQIQSYLNLPANESELMIKGIFSNNISSFIQMAGVQVILFYIIYISLLVYKERVALK